MAAKDDIDLMQHADGELDARAVSEIEKRLASDADARTKVESLQQMSELVRGHVELAVDDVPDARFDAMWRAIDDATVAPAKRPEAARGFWAAFASWFERHRGHVITGAVSAGAVAALALVLRSAGDDPVAPSRSNAINVQPAALRMSPEIESLDVPNGEGTVLNLEDEDGHTTVIWISDADTVEGI